MTSAPALARDVADIKWFHSFQFPDGEEAFGAKPRWVCEQEADAFYTSDLKGKDVLDIGAWDGFFSFDAERRGARRVVATDHFCWSGPGWGTRDGFDYAHARLGSNVEAVDVDVPDLRPDKLGMFDVVLFAGVLYHVKDPLRCIETVSAMARDCVIVETETALDDMPEPVMRYHLGASLAGDPTNFWSPNKRCLEHMFREYGFTRFDFSLSPHAAQSRERGRLIMHAWR